MEISEKLIAAIVSAILGGLLAYLTMTVRISKGLVAKYDLDLRARRIEVYQKLWKHLQPLAMYSRSTSFTKKKASSL